ncbi:MAG: LexA family transcriptional regulator [Gallionella sp.]|nr:LexA family transcriptional regulator [Gallionella sp.]
MTTTDTLSTSGNNPVAEILEALMNKHRLNQTELSSRSGVSQPAINRILNERSKAKNPRKETLQKIAGVLGVTPEQLTGQEPISIRMMAHGAVPIMGWDSLTNRATGQHSVWLACPVDHSDLTFALTIQGEAMIGNDGYREGEIIFIDPGVIPTHGKDVVLVTAGTALFRRMVITQEGRFLKTLNPGWPCPIMPLPADAIICGTVVFSGCVR